MIGLHRWLVQRAANKPLRTAVSLLLAIVLVAGGVTFATGSAATSAPGTVAASETVDIACEVRRGRCADRAPAVGSRRGRPSAVLARWRDLRCGGLPSPRAPDAPSLRRLG